MMKKQNILYYLILFGGGAIIYFLDYLEYMFSYFAIIGFLYTVLLISGIRKENPIETNENNKGEEKNSTLLITQVVLLIIAIGLQFLGLTGKMELNMMMILQMTVVLVLMNGIIYNTERKQKQRHANTRYSQ